MRILLVEDDEAIAKVVQRGLERAHYSVDVVHDGSLGLEQARQEPYSLLILDVMLPGMDGWAICQEVRARRNAVPILMLTARDAVQDRVRGLELGADDYLSKPFDFMELLARVRALLRRDKVHKSRCIRVADLEIDTSLRRVTRAGQEIALTEREYTLLEALVVREGQVLSREFIQEQIWQDEDSFSNTVDVYIRLLRKKIDNDYSFKLIQTVHRLGYCLKGPAPEEAP